MSLELLTLVQQYAADICGGYNKLRLLSGDDTSVYLTKEQYEVGRSRLEELFPDKVQFSSSVNTGSIVRRHYVRPDSDTNRRIILVHVMGTRCQPHTFDSYYISVISRDLNQETV
jgi:hypothetical protein